MSPNIQASLSDALLDELSAVQSAYQAYLTCLPDDVRGAVLEMAPMDEHVSAGRISVLAIPYWVGEAFKIEPEICRQIALANTFGLLHFIAQDRLMDREWTDETIPTLVLSGTLYQQQMFTYYQQFFPPASTFWSLMDKYWLEWAESIMWERRVGLHASFSQEDLIGAARKAAPLKICTSGLAIIGNQATEIPNLERVVDLMHMVMQMGDDLLDMAEDLAGKRFNLVLGLMLSKGALNREEKLSIEQIGRTLFETGDDQVYLRRMQEISAEAQRILSQIGIPQWANLIDQAILQAQSWRDDHVEALVPETLEVLFTGGR